MNKAIFTGNLTRDPETRVMTSGKPRTTFTIAVTRTYLNAQGNRDADFIQIICYEKRAELAEKYLTKERKILVEAHVRTGSYEKDGKRFYTTEFIADKIEFISSKDPDAPMNGAGGNGAETAPDYERFVEVDDGELPF